MMTAAPYNTVVVDLAILSANFTIIRRLAGPAEVMAVVKADAYGHGLTAAAGAFARAGARCFGVAGIEEGIGLREAGIQGEIVLLLGLVPEAAAEAVARNLSPVVFDRGLLVELSRQAVSQGKRAAVHLKLDVGMGRFGLTPQAAGALLADLQELPGLRLAGIMAHFPLADVVGAEESCREQWRQFKAAVGELRAASLQAGGWGCGEWDQPSGADISGAGAALVNQPPPVMAPVGGVDSGPLPRPWLHMANSAALLRFPWAGGDLVRPGISLYGYPPVTRAGEDDLPLQPAMTLGSRVLQLKELPAGCGISYGHRFVTSRRSRLAVLPVGYANGYPRGAGGRAQVLIGGRRVPICGTICMNACMADVTELPEVAPGDEVVLLGRQGREFIGADEIAGWHDTISYEILCRIGAMNPRLYR